MKEGYTIRYFNEYFNDIYNFIQVINRIEINEVHLCWWHEDDYKHIYSIGQWKIKHLKI